eukprot:9448756-Prorocentrum_lima.AAC.1
MLASSSLIQQGMLLAVSGVGVSLLSGASNGNGSELELMSHWRIALGTEAQSFINLACLATRRMLP